MTRSSQESSELHDLVGRLCNEDLDAAGQARLNELLDGDVAAQQCYVRYVDLHAAVRTRMQSLDDEDFTLLEVQAALNALAPTLGDDAASGERVVVPSHSDERMESASTPAVVPRTRWLGGLLASPRGPMGLTAAAAVLLIGFFAVLQDQVPQDSQHAPSSSGVPTPPEAAMLGPAKLSGAVGARWAGETLEIPEGRLFEEGERLELIEGLAEVTFRSGARVIVQGPAVLQIQDDASARVSVGRVAAVTPKSASGFTVHTAVARLTSRDAEFGADVDVDGSLVTQVYRGDVELLFNRGATPPTTFQLAGGQGARIDAASHRVTPLAQPYDLHFVRYLPQHELLVNLADVVAGGHGERKAYREGISLVDGRAVGDYGAPAKGDGRYLRTPSFEFVDGVFIPNAKLGPVQVDSIGRQFSEFPPTAGDCWGGAIMARRPQEEKSLPFIRLEFHGDNYGYVNWLHIASKADELSPQGYGLIGMHSNCGITFDLHAIRARYPNKKVVRFRAQVGNLESKPERYVADAWVIVDGQLRHRREEFSREDGPETIDVPLTDRDRFLVLAVTDVGGNTAYDWVAFGDPVIELTDFNGTSADAGFLRSAPQPSAENFEAGFNGLPRRGATPATSRRRPPHRSRNWRVASWARNLWARSGTTWKGPNRMT